MDISFQFPLTINFKFIFIHKPSTFDLLAWLILCLRVYYFHGNARTVKFQPINLYFHFNIHIQCYFFMADVGKENVVLASYASNCWWCGNLILLDDLEEVLSGIQIIGSVCHSHTQGWSIWFLIQVQSRWCIGALCMIKHSFCNYNTYIPFFFRAILIKSKSWSYSPESPTTSTSVIMASIAWDCLKKLENLALDMKWRILPKHAW